MKSIDLPILANNIRQLDSDVLNNFVEYEVSALDWALEKLSHGQNKTLTVCAPLDRGELMLDMCLTCDVWSVFPMLVFATINNWCICVLIIHILVE